MYDIYLSLNNDKRSEIAALATKIPILAESLSQTDLPELALGFLGLNLSGDMANDLLEEIKLAGIHGFVVPAAYRHPKITRDMAQAIAFEALEKEQKTRFPTVTFEPLQYVNENAMWWKFGAASPEWIERGLIPGVFYILIDKLDGHMWTAQEQVSLNGEEYALESTTTLSPLELLTLLADELGLEWDTDDRHKNKISLKGAALVVNVSSHSYPAFIEQIHGIRPTVQVQFRIIPYKSGYEVATSLMLQAVMRVLAYDLQDAVLVFNAGDPIILLKQVRKKLIRSKEWDSWAGRHFANVLRSYELHHPQNGTWHVDGRKKQLSQLAQDSKNVIAAPTVRHPPKAERAFIRAGL